MTLDRDAAGLSEETSPDEWSSFKSLWFALETAHPEERDRLLCAPHVSAATRDRARRMLAAMPRVGTRFDAPATTMLGFGETVSSGVNAGTDGGAGDGTSTRLIGQRLGPYRVIRLIARGGMGAVYEAERDDAEYRQRVAIKTIWRGADSDVLLQRFRSERQILAALQHPNIAVLVDGGATESGTPWLAMEFVDGVPLDEHCDRNRMSLAARLDLFRNVCQAVHHAHQRLVVHRDLKPSNVLVAADGTVKLLDFGVAKLLDDSGEVGTLTGEGLSPFTAAYAAPEQAAGQVASTATDVYALGALLCTLMTGSPPLDLAGRSSVARLLEVQQGMPRTPSSIARSAGDAVADARGFASAGALAAAVRGELDAIILHALERDPARRYGSVRELSDDVLRYLRRDRVHARPATVAYRLWAFTRRRRAVVVSAIVAVAALLGGSVATLRQARALRDEAARAERAAAFIAGIMSGASNVSQDPVVRVAPAGTVGQLLDSAVVRVPREFPTDIRIRARLYTAFGANYASQSRYASARAVLDSALVLARIGYGPRSDAYARANLESAALELVFHGPDDAARAIDAVGQMPAAQQSASELHTRVLLIRASRELVLGHIRAADSLAASVVRIARTKPGTAAVLIAAEQLRLSATSWITRDPRIYLMRARALKTLADSAGLTISIERINAADSEIEALVVLGRVDSAAARIREHAEHLRGAFGTREIVQVWSAKSDALQAGFRGDTAARREALARGRRVLESMQPPPASTRVVFNSVYVDDALARGDTAAARSMALATRDALLATHSPLYLSFAHLYAGTAQLAAGDAVAAEEELRRGLAVIEATPDLASMRPRLRRALARALALQGRGAEAEAMRTLDPPATSIARCTPGGGWTGCPDIPLPPDHR